MKTATAGPSVDVLPEADVHCAHVTLVREVNEEELPKVNVETLVVKEVLVVEEEDQLDQVVEVVVLGGQLTPLSSRPHHRAGCAPPQEQQPTKQPPQP